MSRLSTINFQISFKWDTDHGTNFGLKSFDIVISNTIILVKCLCFTVIAVCSKYEWFEN